MNDHRAQQHTKAIWLYGSDTIRNSYDVIRKIPAPDWLGLAWGGSLTPMGRFVIVSTVRNANNYVHKLLIKPLIHRCLQLR